MAESIQPKHFIREAIETNKWTHKMISDYFKENYQDERGLSVRSVQRFCARKEIHKTNRISDEVLDEVVSVATKKVRNATYDPAYYNS